MTPLAPQTATPIGPPWMGPVRSRRYFEVQWLTVNIAGCVAATVFFGWWALGLVVLTAGMCMASYLAMLVSLKLLWMRRHHDPLMHALNMGLLIGLTTPLLMHPWAAVVTGLCTGVCTHLMGPTRPVRVHPVALVLLTVMVPLVKNQEIQAVLAPRHVVMGSVQLAATGMHGEKWLQVRVPPPYQAVNRPNPQRTMQDDQRKMLTRGPTLPAMLKDGRLPRLLDILLGATPGPIGFTSQLLVIAGGLLLIYRRAARWPMAFAGLGAAVVTLLVLPVQHAGGMDLSLAAMSLLGWRTAITYIGYQLLASPLLLVLLIFAPLTMPRAAMGRIAYGVLIGGGVVALRWFVPQEGVCFVPLIVVGLLCPLLDRLQWSPFTTRGT